jgi:serine protease Do
MLQKFIQSLVVFSSVLLLSGCGGITAVTALGTVGSAAATKVIEHSAGYGIQTPHTVIEKVMPSVVTVAVELKQSTNNSPTRFVRPGESIEPQPNQFSAGSGFVFQEDGFVVTNWHVIRNAIDKPSIIRIGFSNYSQYEATIYNYDSISDIAILKIINEDNEKFPTIQWGDKPKLGGHAIIIGSPIGLDFSVSFGIISAVDRTILNAAPPFVPYVQTDAAMNRGNSGGPLFDAEGKVIGINTLILSPSASNQEPGGSIGLGFAIDGQYAQDILIRLADGTKIRWSYMGIHYRLLDRTETKSNNLEFGENVIVMKVTDDGAAKDKLIKGDIIRELDGEIVKHTTFASVIARKLPGTTINLDVLRAGKIINVDITLLERPEKR